MPQLGGTADEGAIYTRPEGTQRKMLGGWKTVVTKFKEVTGNVLMNVFWETVEGGVTETQSRS